ncbi:GDSL esterase/lipase At4g10955 [Brachypodium distachyon]|nr:GDSL esterase/lipase At4g10955 [Brachypodium distachyon]|eukprot:XP_010229651.1 GDSL esterase/lipase At4g10955 [Brachypodium distachyon]
MPDAPRHPSAPHYIVAFRGTKLKHAKMAAKMQDLDDDFHILVNTLRDTKRYRRAREAVDELLNVNKDEANPDSSCVVWLAGHSLGAAVALELGRAMMLERVDDQRNLPTFLFNLPRVSLASLVDMLLRKDKRDALYAASNTVKVGVVSVLSEHQKRMEKIFERLARWVPNLYVHEKDPISNGLIGHFGRPQQLREWCCPDIVAKAGMQLSHRDMFSSLFGQEKMQPCLLPSVMLWINSSVDEQAGNWFDLRLAAHKLQQWWKPNSELEQAVNLFVQWFDQRSAAHELQQWWKPNSELSLSPRRHIFFEDMHGTDTGYGHRDTTISQKP